MRTVMATVALPFDVPTLPRPNLPPPKPPPPTPRFRFSVPNLVIDPTTRYFTPSALPILATSEALGSARSLFEKFCSARIASRRLRSMTLNEPSFTSSSTIRSATPLPMSQVPDHHCWTAPKSRSSTATVGRDARPWAAASPGSATKASATAPAVTSERRKVRINVSMTFLGPAPGNGSSQSGAGRRRGGTSPGHRGLHARVSPRSWPH